VPAGSGHPKDDPFNETFPMLTPTMRSKVDSLWDRFWSGGIANPLSAIEQISYLLFMRRLDEMDAKRQEDAEFLGKGYESVFDGKFEWVPGQKVDRRELRWNRFKNLPPEQMLSHVRDKVFPFIKSLKEDDQPFARHMRDAVFILPKASLLVEAVGLIDEMYAEIERERQTGQTFHDTQGDLYEYLLSEIATAGKNGQFRTPRHIIQMMVELVDPKLGELVCDPACGTGGFLLGAFQHVLAAHSTPSQRWTDESGFERGIGDKLTDDRQWDVLRHQTFFGYDFDSTMVRIGLMNLLLHGIDQPNLEYADTLSKKFDVADRYDVVLANPPFKGSIDKGDISERLSLATTKTELLFVARIIDLLRIGGRAGVIVPDGVLFGSSKAHVQLRKALLESCELQGIVSMPCGVFKPYAGVSTAVLFFVKGGITKDVWFYDMTADGLSLDDKRERIVENDIPDVIARWRARAPAKDTDRSARAFFVPRTEIEAHKHDLSINRYKHVTHAVTEYEPPTVILAKLRALEGEILRALDEIERMVS
jgi:type I restriction enzyme M protein